MKVMIVYNPHSAREVSFVERNKDIFPAYIKTYSLDKIPEMLKEYVGATPCIIAVTDDLQGDFLLDTNVDGELYLNAILNKKLEEEEASVHNINNQRLDVFINNKQQEALDNLTAELIDRGVI